MNDIVYHRIIPPCPLAVLHTQEGEICENCESSYADTCWLGEIGVREISSKQLWVCHPEDANGYCQHFKRFIKKEKKDNE